MSAGVSGTAVLVGRCYSALLVHKHSFDTVDGTVGGTVQFYTTVDSMMRKSVQ